MVTQVKEKLLVGGLMFLSLQHSVLAATKIDEGAKNAQPTGVPDKLDVSFKAIANLLIFLVGAVAVIMLIIGGLRYVISQGDSAQVKAAKDTLLYAVIGIVVAILAYAIVNFVSDALT
jgi:hypothetical protein